MKKRGLISTWGTHAPIVNLQHKSKMAQYGRDYFIFWALWLRLAGHMWSLRHVWLSVALWRTCWICAEIYCSVLTVGKHVVRWADLSWTRFDTGWTVMLFPHRRSEGLFQCSAALCVCVDCSPSAVPRPQTTIHHKGQGRDGGSRTEAGGFVVDPQTPPVLACLLRSMPSHIKAWAETPCVINTNHVTSTEYWGVKMSESTANSKCGYKLKWGGGGMCEVD